MKELKRKYMESQSRWRDLNVQRQVYLDLIRDLNVEAEGVKYILSVTVLEGDSICPRQGTSTIALLSDKYLLTIL